MERPDSPPNAPAELAPDPAADALYRSMVEAAKGLVMFTTDAAGVVTLWPAGAEAVLGWTCAEAVGRDVRFLFAEEDRQASAVEREIAQALRNQVCSLRRWHMRKDGSRIFIEGAVRSLKGTARDALLWTGRDITRDRAAQVAQKNLVAELQHRIRNILATVRSIVQRSSQTSETLDELSMHLESRIDSIARTQLMLTRNPGAGIEFEDIVREELLAHAVPDSRLTIEGPPVQLSPKAAEVVTFALHELAINSVKYGALMSERGSIAIVWRVHEHNGESWLRIAWVEAGVQVVSASPRREGFGWELITRRVPYELSGTGTFELRPGGVRATIEFPLRPGSSILVPADRK